jgi:ribosome biogenesis protein Nip4
MKTIKDFIKHFTKGEVDNIKKYGKQYYLVQRDLLELQEKISEKPESVGLFLGTQNKDEFEPSLALLEILAKISPKKVFVNKEAEWLFLCGRDVFEQSVDKFNSRSGLVLVQNENDENLGLGKITKGKKGLLIKNIMDRGEYLRAEGK